MEYRILGKTGYRVSRLGFGSMRLPTVSIGDKPYLDLDKAVEIMHAAFRLGVNYVDCGFLYGNEQAEIANPASQHCVEQGYELEMRTTAEGTTGYCIFDDGTECEEWAYYRGECQPGTPKP